MTDALFPLWAYLAKSPLVWLTVTLGVYCGADQTSLRLGRPPLLNPVLISVLAVGSLLIVTGTPYELYFDGAKFIHFLLGPATVALGVPLYKNREVIWQAMLPLTVALTFGSLGAISSVIFLGYLFQLPFEVVLSLTPKSATAGVSMGISQALGGDVSLTAVTTIATGVIGAIVVTPLMNALHIRDWRARGFAAGLAAHGIGTARALQVNSIAGSFSGVAMGLNALVTAIVVPVAVSFLR